MDDDLTGLPPGDNPDDPRQRNDEDSVLIPPIPLAGAMAPVAGVAAVLGLGTDPDDDSDEARAEQIERDRREQDEILEGR
jgi:hypothetical protein